MKICSKCGQTKPFAEFYDKFARCKHCCQIASKTYYHANADAINALGKEYRKKNAEAAKERQIAYRKRNAEAVKEYKKAWNKKTAATVKIKHKAWREKNAIALKSRRKDSRKTQVEMLAPHYVATLLHMSIKDAPITLIAMKKEEVIIRRITKLLRKAANENSDNNS